MAVSFELMVTLCSVKNWEKENNNNKIENKPFLVFFLFFSNVKSPKKRCKKRNNNEKKNVKCKNTCFPSFNIIFALDSCSEYTKSDQKKI